MTANATGDGEPAIGDATGGLARFVVDTEYQDLPEDVVERERFHLLDTLGCILYGSTTPWARKVVDTFSRQNERGDVPVYGTSFTTAASRAVLINGTSSHSLDFDDYCQDAGVHAGSATVPTALAICEASEEPVSGEALLTAIAVGVETSIRSGYGIGRGSLARGWHIAGWTGAFGAAATAASVRSLPSDQVANALAIAGTQGAGLMGAVYGAEVKRFHMGKAAESGYLGAALAAEGFTGDTRIFEDRWGAIGPTMSDDYDVDAVTDDLGATYELLDKLSFKPYPSTGQTHPSVNAMEEILDDVSAEEVSRVTVRTSEFARDKAGWKYEPIDVMSAQGNLQYAIAAYLVDGKLDVDAYTATAIRRPDVLEYVDRIDVVVDNDLTEDASGFNARYATRVDVETTDGETHSAFVDVPRGFPQNPMDESEIVEKFQNQASRVLTATQVDRVVELVGELEELDDVGELCTALTG